MEYTQYFKNRKILVTGASSGIGEEICLLLSQLGATILLIARREENLQEVVKKLSGNYHRYYVFDLKELDRIDDLIKKIVAENGLIDGFVHSAGVSSSRPLKMLKPKYLKEVMDVNFASFIELSRCITRQGSYNPGLSIVAISSVSSVQGNQSKTAYCASKAALDAAIRCIAKEFHMKGVRANSVLPGLIRTALYDTFNENSQDSDDAKNILNRQYLGIGEPIDVANLVIFLLSDLSRFITGSSIPLDGGRLSS